MRKLNEPDMQYGQMKCRAYLVPGRSLNCDSPIEKLFAELLSKVHFSDQRVKIQSQYKLGQFRYDFALTFKPGTRNTNYPDILIECDGRVYHSTPAQRLNDLKKNELAAKYKIKLLRFSGSDIHRRPSLCVDTVILAAEGLFI